MEWKLGVGGQTKLELETFEQLILFKMEVDMCRCML